MQKTPKPPRRPVPIRLLLLAWLAVLGWVWLFYGRAIELELDRAWLDWDRSRRFARYGLGLPQEGTPDLARLSERLAGRGLVQGAPLFIRIFKQESELELWLAKGDRFELFAVYPICRWSGGLGPKLKEGDRQSPEGFYTVDATALNPASRWHRSFNLGFPNSFDRGHGRTGSFIMVHGGCSSVGCFAMTDPVVDEIWRLVTASLAAGQARFHVHVFPFRMSERRLALHGAHPWVGFWRELKAGHDLFEASRRPPRVSTCRGRYAFEPGVAEDGGSQAIGEACPPVTVSGG